MEGAVLLRHVQLLDHCHFHSGKWQHGVWGVFCIRLGFFYCQIEFSIAISKVRFASVRIDMNSPLLGLLISQHLFSEDGICYVLTAHVCLVYLWGSVLLPSL